MALVKLLGELGRRFGREYELEVRTPVQALQLLACQIPGLTEYLAKSSENNIYWRVVTESPEGLSEEELSYPIGSKNVLVIAPIVTGSGGFGRILAGIALIGAAFLVPGGFLGLSATTIGLFGASLALSGVSQLLTSSDKTPKDSEKEDSYLFSDASGTTAQGKCVPLAIGQVIANGFPVLSRGFSVNEIPV